jgi:hypothetical protein
VTYGVRVYSGDPGLYHDDFTVSAEGVLQYTVGALPAGTFEIRTFNVTSSDGTLTLEFLDLGNIDPNFVVNGIDLAEGGVGALPASALQPARSPAGLSGSAPLLTDAGLPPSPRKPWHAGRPQG